MKLTHSVVLCIALGLAGCNSDKTTEAPPMKNAPKFAMNDFTIVTDQSLMAQLVASDADGDALRFSLKKPPAYGSASVDSQGKFTYQPTAERTGMDMFDVEITDGTYVISGTVNITINRAQLSYLQYSRQAHSQTATQTALSLNGRDFTADATQYSDYADLLQP
ncbi:MAG: cadherin-like domain-containing protein [Gammaproteobacteria bacterium]|nr:cadherin-like domain-containing protein [Gammaproteobacteria bacterium]